MACFAANFTLGRLMFRLMLLRATMQRGLLMIMLHLEFRNSDGNTTENSSSVLLNQSMNSKETTLGLLQLEEEAIAILRFGNYVFTKLQVLTSQKTCTFPHVSRNSLITIQSYNSDDTNAWSHTSNVPQVIMECCLIKNKGKFAYISVTCTNHVLYRYGKSLTALSLLLLSVQTVSYVFHFST